MQCARAWVGIDLLIYRKAKMNKTAYTSYTCTSKIDNTSKEIQHICKKNWHSIGRRQYMKGKCNVRHSSYCLQFYHFIHVCIVPVNWLVHNLDDAKQTVSHHGTQKTSLDKHCRIPSGVCYIGTNKFRSVCLPKDLKVQ